MHRPSVVALVALTLASCGGTTHTPRPPEALVRDAAAAMREVRSFHLEGTGVTSSGRFTFSTDLARDGKLHYAVRLKDERMEMVEAGDSVYMRANSAFWRANGVLGASIRLAGRWVEAPAALVRGLTGRLSRLKPKGVAHCLDQARGAFAYHGTATVSGRRAVVIVDRGNHPGGAPGLLYVQANGPARLLRTVQTGPITPGPGTDPQCSDREASPVRGDTRFSRFNEDVRVAVPKGALPLDALRNGGSTV